MTVPPTDSLIEARDRLLAALSLGSSGAWDLARRTGLALVDVEHLLRELEDDGLVRRRVLPARRARLWELV